MIWLEDQLATMGRLIENDLERRIQAEDKREEGTEFTRYSESISSSHLWNQTYRTMTGWFR